jgi:hypothetical protein
MAHKFKEGDLFKPKSNNHGHAYQIGQVYKVMSRQPGGGGYYMGADLHGNMINNWIFHSDMEPASMTKANLEKERSDLEAKIAEVDLKLAFLQETGLTEYDPDEYKIHKALAVLDSTTDSIKRTKLLAKLMKDVV